MMCLFCRKEANEVNGTSFAVDGTQLDDDVCTLCYITPAEEWERYRERDTLSV